MLKTFLTNFASVTYTNLGCWVDAGARSIPSMESTAYLLTGSYIARTDAINKCAAVAYMRNYTVFALEVYDWNFHKILLPIPKKEMDANPNMKQNPGYVD